MDETEQTDLIVRIWGEAVAKLGYRNAQIDSSIQHLPGMNCANHGAVGFWKNEKDRLEGIIIKAVKFDANKIGIYSHILFAVGRAGYELVKLGYNPFSEDGEILVTAMEDISLSDKQYDSIAFRDSMHVLDFLNKLQ